MSNDLIPSIDNTYRPTLVPGDWLYEKLLIENPKRLKKLLKEEQRWLQETSKPEYQQRMRESNEWAAVQVQHDIASGEFAKRQQEMNMALAGDSESQYIAPDDLLLLGIKNVQGSLTKREVRNAYRRQARKLHPDKGGDPDAFKAMYASYRKLLAIVKA